MAACRSSLWRSSYRILRTPSVIVGHRTPLLPSCRNLPPAARGVSRSPLPASSRLYCYSRNLHCHHGAPINRYRSGWTSTPRNTVRWYSSTNQGGGGASGGGGGASGGGGGGGAGRKGFFQNFLDNLKKGVEKNQEMQESLKGFHEEREKLHQSYVAQQVRLKFAAALEKMAGLGRRGAERWKAVRDSSSKVYKEASETEMAKKGQAIGSEFAKEAQKTAEKVSETAGAFAEEVAKTDVGQAIKKGAEVVREDLIDEIAKESGPYQPPEKILRRSDMATDFSAPQQRIIKPNEEAKGVVATEQSTWDKWRQQWKGLKENNPVSNAFYDLKVKYDESDNIMIRASRTVTDRISDTVGGVVTQTDMAEVLAEIFKIDSKFTKEEFVKQCQFEIIPTVLEAYLSGNTHVLEDWCHEAAFNVLSAIIEQRSQPGVTLECKIVEVRDVDILFAKKLEQGPAFVVTFQAQQLTRKKKEDSIDDELLENVIYIWVLCRDQSIYDPRTAWRVLEFGIQSSGKLLI